MIERHLDAKKKHSLDVVGDYNLSPFLSPNWMPTANFEPPSRGQPH